MVHEKPECEFGHSLLAINDTFHVSDEDGSLVTPYFTVPFLQYCLDHFTNLTSHEEDELGNAPVVKVLICFNHSQPEDFDSRGLHSVSVGLATVMGISLVLSATSIAIAALVRNIFLTTHVLSLSKKNEADQKDEGVCATRTMLVVVVLAHYD